MNPISLRSTLLSASLLVSVVGLGRAQTIAMAKSHIETINGKSYQLTSKLKSVLVSDFTYGWNHSVALPMMIETLKRVGAAEGWKVDVAASGQDVTADKLKDYQVFFANNIGNWAVTKAWSTASADAVQDFVEKQGGGLFLMHGSIDSKVGGPWAWYYTVASPVRFFGAEYPNVPAPVFVPNSSKTHPILEGVDQTTKTREQTDWQVVGKLITNIPGIKAQVLFSMDGKNCTGCTTRRSSTFIGFDVEGGYPVSWTFPSGKGAIGCFMEGHEKGPLNGMGQANWDRFFMNFLYYIAGYDTVQVNGNGIKSPRNLAYDASGISFHPAHDPGVYISKPGNHIVSLFDLSGHLLKKIHGNRTPVDYVFETELKDVRKGIYVARIVVPGGSRSQRFLLK